MKQTKALEIKKYGSFIITPRFTGDKVWFNFSNRGGVACYDLMKGEFVPVKGRVGRKTEDWLEKEYII